MNRLGHLLLRPLYQSIAGRSFDADGSLPSPLEDEDGYSRGLVHAPGPEADRLLLVGGGAVSGLGVVSYDLGLPGQLARRISSATGRGVEIASIGQRSLVLEECAALLPSTGPGRFDALIVEIGSREAVGLLPVARWRRQLRQLLEAGAAAPRLFLIGIAPIPQHLRLPGAMGSAVARKLAQLNSASEQIAAEYENVVFVPLRPLAPGEFLQFGSVAVYERWAEVLAPRIARDLDPELHARRIVPSDEQERQRALDALGLVGSEGHPQIDELVRTARGLLGAAGASLSLIDHDRQWMLSVDHMSTDDVARADAFCATTIQQPEIFVVEDAARDERFASNPLVVGEEHRRFYAGYPLEAPNGHRIGAFCIVDDQPRHFSATDAALLRELALRAQDLLWRLAPRSETPSVVDRA